MRIYGRVDFVHLSFLVVLACLSLPSFAVERNNYSGKLKRSDFPADFVFGAASSAYQYEGAVREGGRGPSIWDNFSHKYPEKIMDHSNGDVAVDFYHRYKVLPHWMHKDDIRMLKNIGMNAFRFSISWSRILPDGKLGNGVNAEGVQFYNNVIDELIANDIKPFVTILHGDVPQALEDEYGSFLQANIVNDFRDYAEVCFQEFGDRVKYWMTMNEPYTLTTFSYKRGLAPPGHSSTKETYIAGHNLLLAHAAAVHLYKAKYQVKYIRPDLFTGISMTNDDHNINRAIYVLPRFTNTALFVSAIFQQGEIGIAETGDWYIPQNDTISEVEASKKAMDSTLGWFLHPLVYGDYPPTMKQIAGNDLPKFSKLQSTMLKGSFDFVGINYYFTYYASTAGKKSIFDGKFVYPQGIRDILLYVKEKYNNPVLYITENGLEQNHNHTLSLEEAINDEPRVQYYEDHLSFLQNAIQDGVNVKGHIAWSLLDDFEWIFGYTSKYGLIYVDREDGLKRYPKNSALWYKKFLNSEPYFSTTMSKFKRALELIKFDLFTNLFP